MTKYIDADKLKDLVQGWGAGENPLHPMAVEVVEAVLEHIEAEHDLLAEAVGVLRDIAKQCDKDDEADVYVPYIEMVAAAFLAKVDKEQPSD